MNRQLPKLNSRFGPGAVCDSGDVGYGYRVSISVIKVVIDRNEARKNSGL